MGQFFDSIKVVKQNYTKYDDWEQAQADERARKEHLASTLDLPQDKVELTKKKAQTIIRATEIMDRYSEDNCEDMEQATGLVATIPIMGLMGAYQFGSQPIINKIQSNINKKINELSKQLTNELGEAAPNAEELKNKIRYLEKKSTRVAERYPFYGLMIYTAALFFTAAATIMWGNSKQKEASRIGRFQAKQKDLKDFKNFVIYTPEQLKQVEEAAKKLPDTKENNGIMKMISDLKAISKDKKAYKEWLASKDPDDIDKLKKLTYTDEQLKQGKADQELIVDTVKEINIKAEEYSENVENMFDTFEAISWLAAAPIGFGINKLLKIAKVSGTARTAASFIIPTLTSLGITMYGTLAQKKASRIGRYVARKDLSENPARLMAYSDEDMEKAKDIKAPTQKKTIGEKISKSFSFLNQYIKDNIEYKKYKKTAYQEQEKTQKALADVKITDEQKKAAQNLQRKVFLAFDEIDEMSQRYSEDVEAGSEIAKNALSQSWTLLTSGGLLFSAFALRKGKFPISKIVNTITNIGLKKDSTLRESINGIYDVLKKDKTLMKKFQWAIAHGELTSFLSGPKAASLQEPIIKFTKEFNRLFENVNPKNPETFKGILDSELKQGVFAKWVRNLFLQSAKLYFKIKADLPLGQASDYKTLIGTGIAGGLPILGVIFSVPYIFNAWLTDIQKKAGKIGIMKAIEKIDDPRIFAE